MVGCFGLILAGFGWDGSIFNGRDLSGGERVGSGEKTWGGADGVLVTKGEGGGWLSTKETYGDFELSLEYRLQEGGNSGVFLRTPREGNPAYVGMEIQILDDDSARYRDLKAFQYTGSVYGVVAAKRGHGKKAGEWNRMRIRCQGARVVVELNGAEVVNADLGEHKDVAGEHPGILRAEGYVGLQSHDEPVEFRKIEVKRL
jgi:hypothetical protein